MEGILFEGRNLSETAATIKRKRPKNAASRDIDCRRFQSAFGWFYRREMRQRREI
jgi:hypothetical protein